METNNFGSNYKKGPCILKLCFKNISVQNKSPYFWLLVSVMSSIASFLTADNESFLVRS